MRIDKNKYGQLCLVMESKDEIAHVHDSLKLYNYIACADVTKSSYYEDVHVGIIAELRDEWSK